MDWGELLQTILMGVTTLLLPVLFKFVADWLRARSQEMLSRVDAEWRFALQEAAQLGVRAAEQSALAKLIANEAEAKKRYACDAAERYLAQFNVHVDLDVIADLIEAEVKRQFGKPELPEGEEIRALPYAGLR